MDNDTASPVKLYKQALLDYKSYNCLICGRRGGNETLRKPTEKGIATFVESLVKREHCNGFPKDCYASLFNFDERKLKEENLNVNWHPKCYANFTKFSKQDITQFHQNISSTRSSKPLIDLKSCCLFCGFKKHNKETKLKLVQYDTMIKKIERCCEIKNDFELKRKIGGSFENLPAYDARYHLKCYLKYTAIQEEKDEPPRSIHDLAFDLLVKEIDVKLEEGRALELVDLLKKYKLHLECQQYENSDSYTVQKLKNKLTKHYGSLIKFTESSHTRQAIYSSQISISDVINIASAYKQSLKEKELTDVEYCNQKILEKAANILLSDIREVEGISLNPLNPEDISNTVIEKILPKSLCSFLGKICPGKPNKKIYAIAQDIVSLQSGGKKKMPKNVSIAISLKSMVRSKEMITILNNLGHCISYDEVLRLETCWASGIIEEGDGYATVPTNIIPDVFTQAAFDNGDYGQENASQHVTNTVLYQYKRGKEQILYIKLLSVLNVDGLYEFKHFYSMVHKKTAYNNIVFYLSFLEIVIFSLSFFVILFLCHFHSLSSLSFSFFVILSFFVIYWKLSFWKLSFWKLSFLEIVIFEIVIFSILITSLDCHFF